MSARYWGDRPELDEYEPPTPGPELDWTGPRYRELRDRAARRADPPVESDGGPTE